MNELKVIGGRRSHDVLKSVLESRPAAKVLDAPAGTGVIAQFLKERGWTVHCCDIDPGNFAAQGFPFTQANLNRSLPLQDASFDAVVCANGLHRLFNPGGAIAEFHRVLRPGGTLYITVNNYASIQKRLRFFFYGSITTTINESRYRQTVQDPEANFRNTLFFPQLASLMEDAGFRIVQVRAASVKMSHRLLTPLAWLVRLGTLFIGPTPTRRNRLSMTASGPICPGGKYLFIEAVKKK
jgi:ubiquinone/menaquinone biosynthesis C-methylase UbiE